ncbi:MAG TPA: hypothetical protein VGR10_04365 [Thermoleophilaceae bacterium]|nr:hypothetical protein [Thermoleophilaceae bacterium]
MRRLEASLPGARTLVWIDTALLVWSVAWIAMGIAVYNEVRGLSELSGTVRDVAQAVESFGGALGGLGDVPLIGDALGGALEEPSQQVQDAGQSAQASGESSRDSIDALSVLLGLAVGLIPSVPLVAVYLPARLSRLHEARAVGAAESRWGGDPLFREFLARRAAQHLSYRRLAEIAPEPWRELQAGRFDRLAHAELERLGVRRGSARERVP